MVHFLHTPRWWSIYGSRQLPAILVSHALYLQCFPADQTTKKRFCLMYILISECVSDDSHQRQGDVDGFSLPDMNYSWASLARAVIVWRTWHYTSTCISNCDDYHSHTYGQALFAQRLMVLVPCLRRCFQHSDGVAVFLLCCVYNITVGLNSKSQSCRIYVKLAWRDFPSDHLSYICLHAQRQLIKVGVEYGIS